MLHAPAHPPQAAPGTAPLLRGLQDFAGSLSQRTYLSLREAILALRYSPGEALRKGDICAALGVSRSPIAEAIARLAQEGLVEVVPQAGTYVARFSMAEIREGAFLREAIEVAAVEVLAPQIAEADLVALRRNLRLQASLVEDGDGEGFYAADRAMHEIILAATGYRHLVQVAETAWVHVNRARQLVLPLPGRVAETLEEHRAILAALEARDPEAARSAMRTHLRQLMRFLVPLEAAHPELFAPPRAPRGETP
jgi:DNA-binding GntR family transcriptional regulator